MLHAKNANGTNRQLKYFPHEKYSDDPDFEKWYRKLKGEMMGLFYFLRIQYKLLKRRYSTSVASFCKRCGRDIHDFAVDDKVWKKVEKHIKYGYTLCYDCFCELCLKEDLPSVWKLERLGKKKYGR